MRQLGESCWIKNSHSTEKHVPCPICGGSKFVTLTLFNGKEYTIDCEECSRGYLGPLGYLIIYELTPEAIQVVIEGIEQNQKETTYTVCNRQTTYTNQYRVTDTEIFDTKEEAQAYAKQCAEEDVKRELEKLAQKEKPSKTWKYHIAYHRNQAKDAKKNFDYHMAKLDVAKKKTKLEIETVDPEAI